MSGEDRRVPEEAPLELADVPRRRRGFDDGAPPPGGTLPPRSWPSSTDARPARTYASAGGTAAPARGSSLGRTVVALALLAAAGYGGWWLYRRQQRDDLVAVRSPYRGRTGMTMDLPAGGGWKRVREQSHISRGRLDLWAEGLVRGPRLRSSVPEADEFLIVVRMRLRGAHVDPQHPMATPALREALLNAAQMPEHDGFKLLVATCELDDSARVGAVRCDGEAQTTLGPRGYRAYGWWAGSEDILVVAYSTTDRDHAALAGVVRSVR